MNALKIFRSSAGSGKTYTLVLEYLRLVLRHPSDYRHILAITFTNKAMSEMKKRILDALSALSQPGAHPMKEALGEDGIPGIEDRARKALDFILHDYSSFSVCTIDSLFQKIIRGMARELRLPATLRLELNDDDVKEEITDRLFDDVGRDPQLTAWLTALVEEKMQRDGKWDVRPDLLVMAGELFHSRHSETPVFNAERIRTFHAELQSYCRTFETRMKEIGERGLQSIRSAGFTESDFAQKASGPAGYFRKISSTSKDTSRYEIKTTVRAAYDDDKKWLTKEKQSDSSLMQVVESHLAPLLAEAVELFDTKYANWLGAVQVMRRIYYFGLFNDLARKLAQFRKEKNILLLSDTPRLLHSLVRDSDVSFIYEKSGLRYRHFLIDEFQDTSGIQWKNLLPLVVNGLGTGNSALVVGDAKQSIYRWRGGDIHLLGGEMKRDLSAFRSITQEHDLDTNYRSRWDVVAFNNAFFAAVPASAAQWLEGMDTDSLARFYSDGVRQKTALKNNKAGYVEISLLEKTDGEENGAWKQAALHAMLDRITQLRAQGYRYGDMALLVRKNTEGNEAAAFLAAHGITQVVSSDSLLLKTNPKITLLIHAFRCLADPSNAIARGALLEGWCRLNPRIPSEETHRLFTDKPVAKSRQEKAGATPLFDTGAFDDNLFSRLLPHSFTGRMTALSKLPVHSAAEELAQAFGFHHPPDAYVERFLDLTLEFMERQHTGQPQFLHWWDESSEAKRASVAMPEAGDALRIITIHKAKGLQFPVVFIPFCDWDFMPSSKDLIWVHADNPPFSEFGELPLHPVKNLEKTPFKSSYEKEIIQAFTDNVNLLYVAFTRAEEQLFAWCPGDTSDRQGAAFVKEVLGASAELAPFFDPSAGLLRMGDPAISPVHAPLMEHAFVRKGYETTPWQSRLVVAARSREFAGAGDERKQAVSRGNLYHRILSGIGSAGDIDAVLDQFVFEGLLPGEEKKELLADLGLLLSRPGMERFFGPGIIVLNERDILLPGGPALRPDRVVLKESGADILDFKTGREEKSHARQLLQYAEVLRLMGYDPVHACLLYTRTGELKEVC